MTAVVETEGVGKRYGRLWALTDCTLSIPAGHTRPVVGIFTQQGCPTNIGELDERNVPDASAPPLDPWFAQWQGSLFALD